jgi:hypothetical protein
MRTLLPLVALLALSLAGCSNSLTAPDDSQPSFSCAGESSNCGGGQKGGGQRNNNPNNPPKTAP